METFCPDGTGTPTVCPIEGTPTVCPKVYTACPPEPATVCPVETRCPEIATQCVIEPIPTVCPEVATECPVRETQCNLMNVPTKCNPDLLTFCPDGTRTPTICPDDPTFCPENVTQCQGEWTVCNGQFTICTEPTVCSGGETICQPVETSCPTEPTRCYPDLPTICADGSGTRTICPEDPTKCPVEETVCPLDHVETFCPIIETECPRIETRCPVQPTRCYPDMQTICEDGTGTPTVCPEDVTKCPKLITICVCETQLPMEPTQCYPEPTTCYVEPTKCGEEPTICYDEPTRCYPAPTVCYNEPTICTQEPTVCYDQPTVCTNVPTVCYTRPTECYSTGEDHSGWFSRISTPVSFSVDRKAEGLNPAQSSPNDVFSLGTAGGHGKATQGEIFQSSGAFGASPDVTNALRISGVLGLAVGPIAPPPAPLPPASLPAALGLADGDNVDALSYGKDGGYVLHFSVDAKSPGKPGTDVNYQAVISPPGAAAFPAPTNTDGGDPGHEAAGDIFKSKAFAKFGSYTTPGPAPSASAHELELDEKALGLQAAAIDGAKLGPPEDNLDALEIADAGDPEWGVDLDTDGLPDPERCVFFSIDKTSPTASGGTPVPLSACILVTKGPVRSFSVYASPDTMGLDPGDDLDALALSDVETLGVLDPGFDEALFSLAPGSPTLSASGRSPADVFYTKFDGTHSLYASADELGLLACCNIDALDISASCPELPTIAPVVPTECPRNTTVCPATPTECGVSDVVTRCTMITICPEITTQCPAVQTRCPKHPTKCQQAATICASQLGVATQCPDNPTYCSTVATQCPSIPTHCAAADLAAATICPDNSGTATVCPRKPTHCPRAATRCPQEQTTCSAIAPVTQCRQITVCPEETTFCPKVATSCPLDVTLCTGLTTNCPDDAGVTTCSGLTTVCPAVVTSCPSWPTRCVASVSITTCPDATGGTWTVCPTSRTRCPLAPNCTVSTADVSIDCKVNVLDLIHARNQIGWICSPLD